MFYIYEFAVKEVFEKNKKNENCYPHETNPGDKYKPLNEKNAFAQCRIISSKTQLVRHALSIFVKQNGVRLKTKKDKLSLK